MSAAAQTTPAEADSPRLLPAAPADAIPVRRLLAFLGMVFGMFMAILDIQIVSASLREIQAGLSASAEEIAWVQTSYLVAEVIMIPLSGYLSRAISTRVMFTIAAGGFTLASLLCATATNIDEMIIYRAIQGFIGGGMIPTVFASSFQIFPRSKQPLVAPMIGLVVTLAPTIGPTVGGYLTDLFSWHWLFLVNLVPGVIVTVMAWFLIDFDKAERHLLQDFDWLNLLSMACFLGSLEYVLEEGAAKDWFADDKIVIFALITLVSAIVFFYRSFTSRQPIVDLRAYANSNFALGSLFSFVMGIGLYGLTYLYPVYLGRVRGYSALQIGETMFLTGICMFLAAPVVGRLMTRIDPRIMMAIGFTGFSLGTWLASAITKDWAFGELVLPQIFRGTSLMMCMVPINNLALGTLPPDRLKNASGLYNLTRNLGGAVGLALINTLMNDRWDLHLARLSEAVSWGAPTAEERLALMTQRFSDLGSDAGAAATAQMLAMVKQQALVMALGDVFFALTAIFILLIVLVPLMRRPAARPQPAKA